MKDLGTRYTPSGMEQKRYEVWEKKGYFTPLIEREKESFCIVIPPPNITGILHMGHALNNTLQDVLTRWRRMEGYITLWLPGTDHAGIATQNVVERSLLKEGIRREDIGREEFVKRCWEWKQKYGGIIIEQLKRLGASCDWSRLRFTLDEGLARAVRTAFKRLYDEGLIYKDTYIINWCPRCSTALSDDEVEHREHQGNLWYVKYKLEDGSGHVVVATTRPETMLGDTAVAVHPDDERYRDLVGKYCILPILNRRMPIIADEYVQKEFGTGVVKITPAHDPNDYLVGKRHHLDEINVLRPDATINEHGGPYEGMDRYECRKKIVQDLEKMGAIEKIEPYTHSIGHCYRCETVVEPYISYQWFVKMQPLAELAIEAVKKGETRFIPSQWENTYFSWLENVRDWCISRQLWWGHRIPAWYCQDCGHIEVVAEGEPATCSSCGGTRLVQDEDVLDTWFSSALWPFSTLGWPDNTEDLQTFYPTSVLVTGHDIIFFWVARMIMTGLKFMSDVPFRDVYINAIIFDEHGDKMSKSKGNAIDPLDIIDEYGADSLRLTLCAYAAHGRKICLSEKRFEGYRNFLNKLWNASRFVFLNTADLDLSELDADLSLDTLELADRWILSRFYTVIYEVNKALEDYKFNEMVNILYHFVWHEFCDWYIELVKPRLYSQAKPDFDEEKASSRRIAQSILIRILEGIYRLFHPIIPFVTEEMWQIVQDRYGEPKLRLPSFMGDMQDALKTDSLVIAPWLSVDERVDIITPAAENRMNLIQNLIRTARNIRGEMNVPPGEEVDLKIFAPTTESVATLEAHRNYFETLLRLGSFTIQQGAAGKEKGFHSVGVEGDIVVAVKLPESLREREIERLQKEIDKLETEQKAVQKKLSNENFISKAPADVVEKEKKRLQRVQTELEKIREKMVELTE